MYVKSMEIKNFRCFEQASMEFQYPGRRHGNKKAPRLPNVNLILGDNGSGKSSVLKAIAVGTLASVLPSSGFRPYLLVRRSPHNKAGEAATDARALISLSAVLQIRDAHFSGETLGLDNDNDSGTIFDGDTVIERQKDEENIFLLGRAYHFQFDSIKDNFSPGFFLSGYGATRRTENGENFDRGARERARSPRYQRVASIFEDYYSLVPVNAWLNEAYASERLDALIALLNRVLPPHVQVDISAVRSSQARLRAISEELIFRVGDTLLPFTGLSDGYRAFIGWVSDLLFHMNQVTPYQNKLEELPGVVMVDEIDLLLHPEWQRTVIESLARAFPNLQFFFTTHSPIVAGTVEAANILIAERDPETGAAIVTPGAEKIYGLSADQILTSAYFGLSTPRATGAVDEMKELAHRAWEGDKDASLTFLTRLAQGFEKENSNGEG